MTATRARGTDLAMFQGVVPFADMVREGIEFSICKATEGHGYIDPKWEENHKRSPVYMRAVGAYHVLRAGNAKTQAAHYARQWERLAAEAAPVGARVIPPVIDFEIMDRQTAELAIATCVDFRLEIERLTGVVPWLYSFPSFLREQCKNLAPAELAECPMWLAWYPGYGYSRASMVDPIGTLDRAKALPTLWRLSRWAAWQYDGNGGERMPNGVDADFNVANGSLEDMLGLPKPLPEPPDTEPQTPKSKSSHPRLGAVKWSEEQPYEAPRAEQFVRTLAEPDGET